MSKRLFSWVIVAIAVSAVVVFRYQRAVLVRNQAALVARQERNVEVEPAPEDQLSPASNQPTAELLRLRGDLGVARRQLDDQIGSDAGQADSAYSNDWQMVYSGARPSEFPDFVNFTNLARNQFGTPASALQSWHFAIQNQGTEPLDATRMKEIWDVPDDFDQEPGYHFHMGEGLYGGTGFRVVSQELLASNVVCLVIDYEKPDGSSYRRERTLVQRNGRWRVRPASVTRAEPRAE